MIIEGREQAYNMKFDAAEKIFDKYLSHNTASPYGYYYKAQLHFWIFLGSRDIKEYQTFLKLSDETQEKIDKILSKEPKNFRMICIAGNLASFRAMAEATINSSVDAFWSSKKAVKYFEESIELNPKYYDSYLGLGLFDYAMSFVPDFLKWAVNLTGLSSDKERGFRYIHTAYTKGIDVKTEAAFHLSKIYTDYLAGYDSAYIYLKELTAKYPSNQLFSYQYAVTLIKDGQLDRAMDILNRVIRQKILKLPQITALCYYRKGEIYFKKNKFKAAVGMYSLFLSNSKEVDFTGFAALNAAYCSKLMGDETGYRKFLLLTKNGNQDIFEDAYAKRRGEKYLNREILPSELNMIVLKNDLDAGKSKRVYDSLKSKIGGLENDDIKSVGLTYYAEASLKLGKYNETLRSADQVLTLKPNLEKWTYPLALVLKAKVKIAGGRKSETAELLKSAEQNNSYEFKDNIQAQIERLKRQLNKSHKK
jgi:Protein of unknown function (DUF3808)